MRKIILSLISVIVGAMPAVNAQQASPGQTTATQQTSKPKARGIQAFPQPKVQPTQATTATSNPGRDKKIANNPEHRKPADRNSGNGKPVDNNIGRWKTANGNGGNYA